MHYEFELPIKQVAANGLGRVYISTQKHKLVIFFIANFCVTRSHLEQRFEGLGSIVVNFCDLSCYWTS